ncbi:hypothetical protein BGZ81_010027 [Podila clonocystis]|nr:hypothetical protein BGZ81_010027 [Podila clonocystis]
MTIATDSLPTPANPGPFGHKLRSQFLFPENYTQFNHGSVGLFPRVVQEKQRAWQDRAEQDPDRWMRRDVKVELAKVRGQVAELLHVEADDLALVENTTTGVNTVLRSLKFAPGDRILRLSTGYVNVNKTVDFVCDHAEGVKLVEVPITFPLTDKEIVDAVEKAILDHQSLKDGTRIRLAVIDWISSVPSIVQPVKQLTELLKSYGILVYIDGAHTIGHIPVDLTDLDPDFYIGNCHKWLFSIRGSAVLYVKKVHQHLIHPIAIPSDYKAGFASEFSYIAAQDFASLLSISSAIEFRKQFGEEAITHYSHQLALEGGHVLAKILGTSMLTPDEHQVANMVNVRLPFKDLSNPKVTSSTYLMNLLMDKYGVFTPSFRHGDHFYMRVCAQIYLELPDFVRLGNIWKEIVDEINAESP